jgi:hypothetical protein
MKKFLLTLSILALAASAQAAVISADSYLTGGSNYAVGGLNAQNVSATGFSGAYTADANFSVNATGPATDTLTLSYTGGSSFTIPLTGFATPSGTSLALTQPVSYRVFQRNASNLATVPVVGTYAGTVTKLQYRTRLHAGASGTATDWTDLVTSPSGGSFNANVSLPAGGWYYLDIRAMNGTTEVARSTVDRVGSGEVFVCSGQSNSANAGAYPNGAPDDRVATVDWTLPDNGSGSIVWVKITNGGSGYTIAPTVSFSGTGGATATATVSGGVVTGVTITNGGSAYQAGPTVTFSGGGGSGAAATAYCSGASDPANWPQTLAWRRGDAPMGPSDGPRGCLWPVLGGKLVEALGVPVGFINVGKGGMPLEAWSDGDGRQLLWPLLNAITYVGNGGARALLWHQGESNGHMTTSGQYYNMLKTLIDRSRSSGWSIDWVVAQASILGDAATNLAVVGDQARIATDLAYVYPGPNTDQLLNAAGSDPLYRNNPGVRWDNIHFNPKGMNLHANLWQTKLNDAFALSSTLTPDTTAPVNISGWPKADTATPSGFTARAMTNEAGTAYYVVVADGAAAPTAAEVKTGTASGGGSALKVGSMTLTANTEGTAPVTGLSSSTAYDVYIVAQDAVPNLQASPVKVDVTTAAPDTGTLLAYESFDYTVGAPLSTSTNSGTGWSAGWTVVSGSAPTVTSGSLGLGALATGGQSVTQNAAVTVNNVTRPLSSLIGGNVTSSTPATFWLSFVHQGNGLDSSDSYLGLYRDGGSVDALMIGRQTGGTGFRLNSGLGGNVITGTALPFDSTKRLLLVRLDLSRTGAGTGTNIYTARLWSYTSSLPTSEPAIGTEVTKIVSGTAGAGTGIQGIRLYDNTSGANSQFDEIRVGTSFGSVVPAFTLLESWRSTYFGQTAATGDAADAADPDADGVRNLVEFALGSDPTDSSDRSDTVLDTSGNFLTLTFIPQRTGVTYSVEAGSDLAAWTALTMPALTVGQSTTVTDTQNLSTANPPRRFLRLKVSVP